VALWAMAVPWQELSDVAAALVGCGHVSGLSDRRYICDRGFSCFPGCAGRCIVNGRSSTKAPKAALAL
jgi:hypothetical protein